MIALDSLKETTEMFRSIVTEAVDLLHDRDKWEAL